MNRAEFMSRLASLLQDVPLAEREEAIQYYNDYFDDAGEGNEAGVIAALGSPEELARSIKAGLTDGGNSGEFTESGFHSYEQKSKNQVMSTRGTQKTQGEPQESSGWQQESSGWQQETTGWQQKNGNGYSSQTDLERQKKKEPMSGGRILLIILLAILLSPVWVGILGSVLGGGVGLLVGLLGIFIGFVVIGVVLTVVGVALVITGIVAIFGAPLGGLCLVGGGLILVAVGLVFVWLMVLVVGEAIPALVRGLVNLCSRIFHRGGAQA